MKLNSSEGGTFRKSAPEGGKFSPRRQISLPRCGREDGEPDNAPLATDRYQPSPTNPTDSPNPLSLTTPTEFSAPSAQQEPLKHTDEGIRQLAEHREQNYREEQSVDASVVLRILEQEAETDG